MAFKTCLVLALVGFAVGVAQNGGYSGGAPAPSHPRPPPQQGSYGQATEPAKYDFDWAVKDDASGNDFGHQESRDGDYTQGSYYVLLPDGRIQRVNYNVQGDSGFVADVTYEGEARAYTPQPSYGPAPSPQPSYSNQG
ncbi:cuticle protein 7-like [Oratosquilla oratoria]|uniref:cuticle protein 7-like n=1 Tax=Oratosquilla oratoria TaxID=337810 RepID=UPI003F76933A